MTTTQHHVGQVTKAQITTAHVIETAPAGATPEQVAAVIVEQLQADGWTAPPDPNADVPPLRPARVATDEERQAAMTAIRGVFARPRQP